MAPRGRTRPPGPQGLRPHAQPPAPFPFGPAPSQAYTPAQTLAQLRAAVAPTLPSEKAARTPKQAEPVGLERSARRPESGRAAERPCCRRGRASRAPHPPALAVHLLLGAADLPNPSGGNESCHDVSPQFPLASRTCEAPPQSREGGCAPARVRPVALPSSSSFHYIIFSFSEGWAGAGGLGRGDVCNFSSLFLLPPPSHHHQSALKKTMWKGVKKLGR